MRMLDAIKPKNPVEAARAEVAKLMASEAHWSQTERQRRAELTEAQLATGGEMLDLEPEALMAASRASAARIRELSDDVATATRAVEAARARRREMIPVVWKAEASTLRSQAAKLRQDSEKHKARADELRQALEDFEDCPFAVAPSQDLMVGNLPVRGQRLPISQRLLNEAAELERRATQLVNQRIVDRGELTAHSADALVAAITGDPMRIGPTLLSIYDWCAEVSAAERSRRSRIPEHASNHVPLSAPMTFKLYWEGAAIIRRSRVVVAPVLEPFDRRNYVQAIAG